MRQLKLGKVDLLAQNQAGIEWLNEAWSTVPLTTGLCSLHLHMLTSFLDARMITHKPTNENMSHA